MTRPGIQPTEENVAVRHVYRSCWSADERFPGAHLRLVSPRERDESCLDNGALDLKADRGAFVYWSQEELLAMVVPYMLQGLREGDVVLYIADDLPLDALRRGLAEEGVDIDRTTAEGRLTLTTAEDILFTNGIFDMDTALRRVATACRPRALGAHPRVRISIEMTFLLAKVPGAFRGADFEARLTEQIVGCRSFMSVSSFNASRDITDTVADALKKHPVLLRNGKPFLNPYYRPWRELQSVYDSR